MVIPAHEKQSGWGVIRLSPWHFVGLFEDDATAQNEARLRGPDYLVRYGDWRVGTDHFIWEPGNHPPRGPETAAG